MKNETVAGLLESGEIVKTEDVIFMLDVISQLFNRGMDDGKEQFFSYAMQMLEVWQSSLESNDGQLLDESVMNIVMGKS